LQLYNSSLSNFSGAKNVCKDYFRLVWTGKERSLKGIEELDLLSHDLQ